MHLVFANTESSKLLKPNSLFHHLLRHQDLTLSQFLSLSQFPFLSQFQLLDKFPSFSQCRSLSLFLSFSQYQSLSQFQSKRKVTKDSLIRRSNLIISAGLDVICLSISDALDVYPSWKQLTRPCSAKFPIAMAKSKTTWGGYFLNTIFKSISFSSCSPKMRPRGERILIHLPVQAQNYSPAHSLHKR